MSKLSEYELRRLGQQAVDFADDVRDLVNNGKYQSSVATLVPAWTANTGEFAFFSSGSDRRLYLRTSSSWQLVAGFDPTLNPGASGTAGAGTGNTFARIDHVHPAAVAGRVHRTAGDVTTTATTLTDLTGASITLTTGANPVLLGFSGTWLNDSARTNVINFDVDGTLVLGTVGVQSVMIPNEAQPITVVALSAALTAASHTFKVQWYETVGGGAIATMKGGADLPYNFWVREIVD